MAKQVRTNKVIYTGFNSYFQFCTNAVCSTDKYWILVSDGFHVERTAETTYFGIGTWTTSGAYRWFDDFNNVISCVY
jgi:hypothetical protein